MSYPRVGAAGGVIAIVALVAVASEGYKAAQNASLSPAPSGRTQPTPAEDDAAPHQWWAGRAYEPGNCFEKTDEALSEIKQYRDADMAAVITWNRSAAGYLESVKIPATDGGGGFFTYYRTKAACDTADRASYDAGLRQIYGEN